MRAEKGIRSFYKNAGFKVAVALPRGGSPGQTGRRSEIGSHAPPKTVIFICGGELEKVMGHFSEKKVPGTKAAWLTFGYRLQS